ncbi:hypothetical protein L6R50_20450 [Myxococcota bacterium]|nr:hypothetical protein [Myxococcota bacterium]
MTRSIPLAALLGAGLLLAPAGTRGASTEEDIIDQPGSPTDRYLSDDELRSALHAANPAFFACFSGRTMNQDPGDVSVYFTVPADGVPVDVRAEVPNPVPGLAECLATAVAALRFQDHDGDPVEAAYPVVFVRDEKGARVIPYPTVFTRDRAAEFVLFPVPPALDDADRSLLHRVLFPPA